MEYCRFLCCLACFSRYAGSSCVVVHVWYHMCAYSSNSHDGTCLFYSTLFSTQLQQQQQSICIHSLTSAARRRAVRTDKAMEGDIMRACLDGGERRLLLASSLGEIIVFRFVGRAHARGVRCRLGRFPQLIISFQQSWATATGQLQFFSPLTSGSSRAPEFGPCRLDTTAQ